MIIIPASECSLRVLKILIPRLRDSEPGPGADRGSCRIEIELDSDSESELQVEAARGCSMIRMIAAASFVPLLTYSEWQAAAPLPRMARRCQWNNLESSTST
jgi:hypothetical protein